MYKRQTFEEVLDATFLDRGTGEIGKAVDEMLSGEENKDKVKKVKVSELVATIPYAPIAHPNSNDNFQQWLYRQKQKDQIIAREKLILRECSRQEALGMKEKKQMSNDAFKLWKFKKDIQSLNNKKQQQEIDKMLESIKEKPNKTETLPGYISTWSCDVHLAKKMQKVCPRSRPIKVELSLK
ncbi:hypothetical protein LOD99_2727 [Oopsacas minuta]|uniref:Uncharacterized protein n=1 Tax=Oopsacas minuta TaxID=111878 RepID=A0AAV7K1L5_9METZ|nr:hypothetical protein LOD99_2727 [Oopsacas minuta]